MTKRIVISVSVYPEHLEKIKSVLRSVPGLNSTSAGVRHIIETHREKEVRPTQQQPEPTQSERK